MRTPGMVVRGHGSGKSYPTWGQHIRDMEWWNTIDIDGNLLGEWRKFEKEDA